MDREIPRIALFLQGVRHYERELLRGISDYANLHGPWRFHRSVSYLSGDELPPGELIRRWQPDAMIIRESSPHRFDAVFNNPIPTLYSPTTERRDGVPNIVVDDVAVGAIAANHFWEIGLRQFAYCGVSAFFWSRLRGSGYAAALERTGHSPHAFDSGGGDAYFGWNPRHLELLDWLAALPKPVGIFCCTDDFSLLVQEACETLGLGIPHEVALIGVGNDESICRLARVSLSSIRLNIRRGGYDAAERLAAWLASGPTPPRRGDIVIEPLGIIARQSTDAAKTQDREIARAISFIHAHANRPLAVQDVVDAARLSRRRLYDRFREATGKNISAYIRDRRLAHFARQLLETSRTVSEIAFAMGYDSDTNVARLFKNHFGVTPRAYRRKHAASSDGSNDFAT